MFVKSIEPTIRQSIEEVYKQLQQIKGNQIGPGNNSGQQKGAEAMLVTKSLLDYLDQRYVYIIVVVMCLFVCNLEYVSGSEIEIEILLMSKRKMPRFNILR